jgi:Bacterial SH3 domain
MHSFAKYAAVSLLFTAAACGASALGFAVAGDTFVRAPTRSESDAEVAAVAQYAPVETRPTSELLGSEPRAVIADQTRRKRKGTWVEVVDAVNMRAGPSSANPVIKVQFTGTKLRVTSHQDGWVQVAEPRSGDVGWIYGTYVRPIEPISRRAEIEETATR